jgi:peptidoglycan/xylan/chitin deacetylase (PgdA/CDA1 family)
MGSQMSLNFLSKSRGNKNLFSRIRSVLSRFSISSKKFDALLRRYRAATHDLGCVPTFPVTAVTLKRHPGLVKELCQNGIDFAVHGYIHTDYSMLPLEEQVKHFKKAIAIFKKCQVPFTGFRAPFVRVNDDTYHAISGLGFPYDSSQVVHWDVLDSTKYTRNAWHEYERVIDFYQSRQARDYLVLPRSIDGIVEIPVSMPDDEIMVERLDITDNKEISRLWRDILHQSYRGGELFVLQLHPERILCCESALPDVVQEARQSNPPVWISTLKEITAWWREREKFRFEVNPEGDGRYAVHTECSDRATVLLKNCKVNVPAAAWSNGYQSIAARDFILESPVRPVIGVSSDAPTAAVDFLRREGYIVEPSERPDNCGIYLSDLAQFGEADEKPLSEKLEQSQAPLLRYWRWPARARSALSVTGDIDSITLIDFALRIWENGRQRL